MAISVPAFSSASTSTLRQRNPCFNGGLIGQRRTFHLPPVRQRVHFHAKCFAPALPSSGRPRTSSRVCCASPARCMLARRSASDGTPAPARFSPAAWRAAAATYRHQAESPRRNPPYRPIPTRSSGARQSPDAPAETVPAAESASGWRTW